jgi:uncharacterized protein (TIGR02453 family)
MAFRGWPEAAFDFYRELEGNNNRPWWQAHRDTYDSAVRAPFDELSAAVEAEFGPLRTFRPNRDVRFSKDKSPYKTAAAAMTETDGGSSYYIQISSEGVFVGAGMYHLAGDQLERFRTALLHDRRGPQIARIADDLSSAGYDLAAAETLKTAPRGWDKEHPRIELARRKGLVMARQFPRAKWQSTAKALDRIVAVWRDARPMNDWLDRHVGPSTLPPPEPR